MARSALNRDAPSGGVVLYDRQHLLVYAELLDADDAGLCWREGASDILGIDPGDDPEFARSCWISHLARARWMIGDGLHVATEAFGALPRFKGSEI